METVDSNNIRMAGKQKRGHQYNGFMMMTMTRMPEGLQTKYNKVN